MVSDIRGSASGGDAAKSAASSESFSGDVEFSSPDDKITGPADAACEFVSADRIASLSLGRLSSRFSPESEPLVLL